MEKMFEKALRNQYRFPFKGMISTEDLWTLSTNDLDSVYRSLAKTLRGLEEDSLIVDTQKDRENAKQIEALKTKIEIVKYIFSVKTAEAEERKESAEKAAMKRKLMDILAEKQDAALMGLSEEELRKKISELG